MAGAGWVVVSWAGFVWQPLSFGLALFSPCDFSSLPCGVMLPETVRCTLYSVRMR